MASTDATLAPWHNQALRITFDLRLNTGALNSGAAGLQAQVSLDGAAFVNTTNSPIEIASSSGIYYLDLLAAETNGDTVVVVVKSSTAGAITQSMVFYTSSPTNLANFNTYAIGSSSLAATRQATLIGACPVCQVDSSTYAPTTVDFEVTALGPNATDYFKGRSIIFTSGALNQQAARIVGSTYTANNKQKLTVTALTAAPVNLSYLVIV